MPRLFFGNFDFEHSLGHTPLQQLSRNLREVNAKWCVSLIPLMSPGDYLWLPQLLIDETETWQHRVKQAGVVGIRQVDQIPQHTEIEFVPWGWTEKLIRWAEKQGWKTQHPEMPIIAWANSRATSFEYEQQWESAPTGAIELLYLEDLNKQLTSFPDDEKWVMKAEFSMSARERMIGQGQEIPPATLNWLKKRLLHSGRVFFEPWLNRIEEKSFHYEISPDGEVIFLGMTELLTDDSGRYLSNRFVSQTDNPEIENWTISRLQTMRLAQEFAQKGYFGPLSIDAMRYYCSKGICHERPLQDVNARYSMGRCELEKGREMEY